nr:4-(cytidine 5'-diphospho)-2-C-methyl-D-erythritol kinase [Alphaproteobacteria bacterium]
MATAGGGGRWEARAKINLYLHVTGRRTDGYHCLDSLVVFAKLADIIADEANSDLALSVDGPFAIGLPPDQNSRVLQAAKPGAKAAGVPAGARSNVHE